LSPKLNMFNLVDFVERV